MATTDKINAVISVASWEERFVKGIERLIDKRPIERLLVFYYKEYLDWSKKNIAYVRKLCKERSIKLKVVELSFQDNAASWFEIRKAISSFITNNTSVCIDLTTSPRETIWTSMLMLEGRASKIYYNYNAPREYNSEWLSRDPNLPRLVYKLGGIARLGFDVMLIMVTGFDSDRIRQLISYYEPKKCVLAVQKGDQFRNRDRNLDHYVNEFRSMPGFEIIYIDSYELNEGYKSLKLKIEENVKKCDIILGSLGPKLSAIPLFTLHRQYENTALAYAPSGSFNKDYSKGITKNYFGLYRQVAIQSNL